MNDLMLSEGAECRFGSGYHAIMVSPPYYCSSTVLGTVCRLELVCLPLLVTSGSLRCYKKVMVWSRAMLVVAENVIWRGQPSSMYALSPTTPSLYNRTLDSNLHTQTVRLYQAVVLLACW